MQSCSHFAGTNVILLFLCTVINKVFAVRQNPGGRHAVMTVYHSVHASVTKSGVKKGKIWLTRLSAADCSGDGKCCDNIDIVNKCRVWIGWAVCLPRHVGPFHNRSRCRCCHCCHCRRRRPSFWRMVGANERLFVYCLLAAPYQAPNLVHKMLVLKEVEVFSFPRVLYGWILQSDLTFPCDLEWSLAGR